MDIQSNIPYTGVLIFIFAMAAASIAYGLYFYKKNEHEFMRSQRITLAVVRGLSLFVLGTLLLALSIQSTRHYTEKPTLVVAVDNSESMAMSTPNAASAIQNIISEIGNKFDDKFNIQAVQFGEKTTDNITLNFADKTSDYVEMFENLQNKYYNLNLGAVVLIGDGIVNKGKSPVGKALEINTPIYTIGLGDTLTMSDQAVTDVAHNNSVFIGNDFNIQVDLNFNNFIESKTHLDITYGGKIVISEDIDIPQPNFFLIKKYKLTADKPGVKNISVRLTPSSNESNTQNNRFSFAIEVHEEKQKVLLLSQGPHPDLGAISEALKQQANFDVRTVMLNDFKEDPSDFDLIVLNQLPSLSQQKSTVFDKIKESKTAVLAIVGPSSSIAALNNMGLNFSMEPSLKFQESLPYFDNSFSFFSLPDDIETVAPSYPPLVTFFTKYQIDNRFSVLAYQKINGLNMDYPLAAFGNFDNRKIGVIFGEGIWRWKMHEFQNFDNDKNFSSMVINIFTYMCAKENRDRFQIRYKSIVDEITPVKIKAKVLDEIFEPIKDAEISLTLSDSTNADLNYIFDPTDNDYELNLGYLAPGDYHFVAETNIGDQKLTKQGSFSVQAIQLENQNLKADFGLLKELAATTDAKFFTMENATGLVDELSENIKIESKEHLETSILELIEWRWLLLIIMLLLTAEWFLRKFWGSY